MVIGDRIKEARTEYLAFTQRDLADKLGIDQINVSRWERGVSEPRLTHIRAIAKLAGLPVNWFFEERAA